jgi:hypothetical protein
VLVVAFGVACESRQNDASIHRQASALSQLDREGQRIVAPDPVPEGATFAQSLACVEAYVKIERCDWEHWTEMYLACRTHEHKRLDDGFLLEEVKAGRCTSEHFEGARTRMVDAAVDDGLAAGQEARLARTLSPGAEIMEADRVVLEEAEWFSVQRYVDTSLGLPTTEQAIRKWLGLAPSDSFSRFAPLRDVFTDIQGQGLHWQQSVFPEAELLALDLVSYADSAEAFYPALLETLAELEASDDEAAHAELLVTLENLTHLSRANDARAALVEEMLHDYAANMEGNAQRISTLTASYQQQMVSEPAALSGSLRQLAQLNAQLEQANKDYEHYVTVAATSPSYAWVGWPFGMIAAASVAGVYGDKATKTLARIRELERSIASLGARVASDYRLIGGLGVVVNQLGLLGGSLDGALPAVQKVRAHWQTMTGDLERITKLSQDIALARGVVRRLRADESLLEWREVGEAARAYLGNTRIELR